MLFLFVKKRYLCLNHVEKNYIIVPLCSKQGYVSQENEEGFGNSSKQFRAVQGIFYNGS